MPQDEQSAYVVEIEPPADAGEQGASGEILELTDFSAWSARKRRVRSRQLLKVDKKAGLGGSTRT